MEDTSTTSSSENAKVILHWLDGSRAQSILWLLEELKAPYELDIHHRSKSFAAPPELEHIHPLGKSPLVTVRLPESEHAEPIVLAESGFIAQYLCDHWGGDGGKDASNSMVPRRWKEGQEGKVGGETKGWLRYQYLLYYIEGSLMPYNWLYLIMSALKGPSIPFFIRPITAMITGRVVSMLIFPNMAKHYGMLEGFLSDEVGGKYLCGPHLTAADILILFPLLSMRQSGALATLGPWEKGTPEETYPRLFEYVTRLEAEPGYKGAVEKIRELEGDYYVAPAMP